MITPIAHLCRGAVVILTAGPLLAGCGSSTAGPSADDAPVTRGLAVLVSTKNRLYYPPFLRDEPAGIEDNSYAVRLRTLLGEEPVLRLAADRATFFQREALAASPLWGRSWLAPLARAGASGLLGPADGAELRSMRTPEGWFGEPGERRPDGTDNRVSATAAALDALDASGGITPDDRNRTLPWLVRAAESGVSLHDATGLAQAFRLLGAPVPGALRALPPPATGDITRLADERRHQALLDTYDYAELTRAAGASARLDPSLWAGLLEHNAGSLGYRDLYLVAVAAHAAGVPSSSFAVVRQRISADTLPDGTVRDASAYVGSPEASLYGLRLRSLAGESTRDEAQAAALSRAAADPRLSSDPHVRLTIAAAVRLAGDEPPVTAASACATAPDAGPIVSVVSVETAEAWARTALACADVGADPPETAPAPWPLETAAEVTAAATVVTTLADIRQPERAPSWITAAALEPWATNADRLSSVSAFTTVVRAYLLLGGTVDDQQRDVLVRDLQARQGCPQLPQLYRADVSEPGCDFKATWAAWKLRSHLGLPVPGPTNTPK